MKRGKRCAICGNVITAANRSLKPGECLDCRFGKYRQDKPKRERQEPIRPIVVYGDGDEWKAPGSALFGGYDFGNANVNPLG